MAGLNMAAEGAKPAGAKKKKKKKAAAPSAAPTAPAKKREVRLHRDVCRMKPTDPIDECSFDVRVARQIQRQAWENTAILTLIVIAIIAGIVLKFGVTIMTVRQALGILGLIAAIVILLLIRLEYRTYKRYKLWRLDEL
ncbi:MAG TPA: hypothetical protein ENG09_00655, partial [Candidatus Syntrophoarchaeum butanivorans]|nr:hypothetical protein [Candidatus Syntrophoarchaeum butanivorans]